MARSTRAGRAVYNVLAMPRQLPVLPPESLHRKTPRRAAFLLLGLLACALPLPAQEPEEPQAPATTVNSGAPNTPALTLDTTRVPVRGVVRDAASGQTLARVQVQIEGDARNGTLTDGEGRFEFEDVPVGPQIFLLNKPGYRDQIAAAQPPTMQPNLFSSRNVIVAATMPALQFSMQREAVLHGIVRLDTGDPAENLTVQLARQEIRNGRLVWELGSSMRARADGSFRFAHLVPGAYALLTHPWLERTNDAAPTTPTWGYAPALTGDLEPIQLASGSDQQIDLTLNRALFQPVTVRLAGGDPTQSYRATITDAAGHPIRFMSRFEAATHTLQLLLPDGDHHLYIRSAIRPSATQTIFESALDVHVAGHPVETQASLVPQATLPIEVLVEHLSSKLISPGRFLLEATPDVGWASAADRTLLLHDITNKNLSENRLDVGRYWVTPLLLSNDLCAISLTAGSSNLATEPLTVGLGGSTAPLTLRLRDNCAQLTLALPEGLRTLTAGEEPVYTVYLVPTFASPLIIAPLSLRPTSGGTATLKGLTPGDYRLYVLRGTVQFAYHSDEARQQTAPVIHLAEGESKQMTIEVPQ